MLGKQAVADSDSIRLIAFCYVPAHLKFRHFSSGVVWKGVGWVGLEPTTNALKGRCSTIELPTPVQLFYAAVLSLATNPRGQPRF
jgi:hypothetical protein